MITEQRLSAALKKIRLRHTSGGSPMSGLAIPADYYVRSKRSDVRIDTLRKEYGNDCVNGHRSDAKVGTVLRKGRAKT